MTLTLLITLALSVAFGRSLADWWRCRTPLALVNAELQRARRRRR